MLNRVHTVCLVATILSATDLSLADDIVFGMSTALSGPAASLGNDVRLGFETAFDEQNAKGGINGSHLKLIALDDGYEPDRTAPNIHELINEHKVLGIVGNVGTPTAVVTTPIAIKNRTLFFAPYTGAGLLRKSPPDRYVFNYRASYAEETAAMVDALLEFTNTRPENIAFFTQRDSYGDAGFAGGMRALSKHEFDEHHTIIHSRYERNTTNVESAIAELLLAEEPVRAVIMVGAYKPCAAFIKLAKQSGINALFLNVSFVGADPLNRELGDQGEKVIITQVVPHYNLEIQIAKEFRTALINQDPNANPSFASFEGYIAARILQLALLNNKGPITHESILSSLEKLNSFDIGLDLPLKFSESCHQACNRIWPTMIQSGKVMPIDWQELKNLGAE